MKVQELAAILPMGAQAARRLIEGMCCGIWNSKPMAYNPSAPTGGKALIRSNPGNLATKCVECPGHQNRVCHGKSEGIEFFGRVTLVGYRQQIDGMIAVKEGIRDFRYTPTVDMVGVEERVARFKARSVKKETKESSKSVSSLSRGSPEASSESRGENLVGNLVPNLIDWLRLCCARNFLDNG